MRLVWFFVLLVGACFGSWFAGLNPQQTLAVTIFSSFILGTLLYWQFRLAFAFIGITALLATKLIDLPHLIEFASLDIILFLAAMMIVIGFLEERRFFEVLMEKLLGKTSHRPHLLFPTMMVLAMVSAALVDEVTSILFMTSLTLHLTRRLKLHPFPYIVMIVLATNIGSSATVVGNPIGVLIALRAGLSFNDFLRWATPISLAALGLTIIICSIYFRKPLADLASGIRRTKDAVETEKYSKQELRRASILFGLTILGLVFHHQTEHLLHLPKNTLLLGIPFLMAGIALLIQGDKSRELVEKRVDWWTLAFFLLLFASVGTLRYVGVTDRLAAGLQALSGSDTVWLMAIVMTLSGLLTAFLDNVLAVATFIPVIADLGKAGLPVFPLWWALLFGGTLGGNATMIGSTANIVAVGMLEREKEKVSFGRWLGPGLAVTLPTLGLSLLLLVLQLPLMGAQGTRETTMSTTTEKKSSVELRIGQKAPDFELLSDEGKPVRLSDFRGKKVVLYFYPKDNTPGCTKESCSFRDGLAQVRGKNAVVLGVSADSVSSHRNFKEKFKLNFPLLSDSDKKAVQTYGVWKEKSMFGKKYMGLERTTVLIDEEGKISKIFPKVQVDGHLEEVLAAL